MALPLPTIAATVLTLPPTSFPRAVARLERMARDPGCSAPLLAAVLDSDPMLSALVLSRANVANPGEQPVLDNVAGIVRLGLSMVQGLLHEVRAVPASQRQDMAAAWAMANACAVMARIVAAARNRPSNDGLSSDTIHLAALCHDLGSIIAILHFHGPWQLACQRANGSGSQGLSAALSQELGLDQPGLGALLARSWGLPAPIAAAMRWWHRPGRSPEFQELTALVHVARSLVRACGFVIPGDEILDPIDPEALNLLGLRVADVERVIVQFFDQLEELELYEGVLLK